MVSRIIDEELAFRLRHFPAICLLGLRQVGKTLLVKRFVQEEPERFLYLDMENPEDLVRLEAPMLFLKTQMEKTVVLDEVQRKPELFPMLRSLIDMDRKPGRYILLGSASPDLSKETAESLAGRISYLHLHPFIIQETGGDWKKIWVRGGMPGAYLEENERARRMWFTDFIQTYFQKDLPQMGLPANPAMAYRLFQMLSATQANLLNIQLLAKSLQISHTTLSRYLFFFENAFLIYRLQPYSSNINKRLVKTAKCYVTDSGIVHNLLQLHSFEQIMGHPVSGFTFEGTVLQHLRCLLPDECQVYFYRTHEGAELDFVVERGGKIVLALDSKLSNTPTISRGTTIALQDFNNPPMLIVTPEAEGFFIRDGIEVTSIKGLEKKLKEKLGENT